jgi:putative aldouronate transport system permease protein
MKKKENPALLRGFTGFGKELFGNRTLYLMALPAVILFILFNYLPLAGIIIAFKDYNFREGIFGSRWAAPFYKNFIFFFKSGDFIRVTSNTLMLNFSFIFFNTISAVLASVMLNEVTNLKIRKVLQGSLLLPYFVSWVVVAVFVFSALNYDYGIINTVLRGFGREPVNFYIESSRWPGIMTIIYIWKSIGYSGILYSATLAGISPEYYEAATIDGAGRLQQIWHISLPHLVPTITILTLLSIGKIMNADFGMFYSIIGENPMLYPSADVIDTYVYRTLRKLGDVGMSSAAGFYQSTVAFFLVLVSNWLARRYQPEGSLF